MASRSLTDRARSLRRLLSPGRFLAGRLTPEALCLSLISPNGRLPSSGDRRFPLDGDGWEAGLLEMGLPREERERTPFLLFWPDERTLTAAVTLPPSVTAGERETVAGAEVESLLPWPLEETLFSLMPQKGQPSRVHIWAASQSEVGDFLRRLEDSGLSPRWILPESLLLADLLRERPPTLHPKGEGAADPTGKVQGIIHAESHRAICQILEARAEGEDIIAVSACRTPPGTSPLDRDRRILDMILSLAASAPSLPERFLFDQPLASGSPLLPLASPVETLPRPLGERAYRLLSRLSGEEISSLTFRKGALAWQGDRAEIRTGIRSLAALSMLLVGVLVADGSAHLSRMDHRVARAREALEREARKALPDHAIVMPVEQLTQEKAALDRQRHLLSRGADIIGLMKTITTAPPSGVRLELVSLAISRRFVTLSGKTESFKSVDAIKSSLAATGMIHDLSILSAGLDIDRKTVTFRMRGRHD